MNKAKSLYLTNFINENSHDQHKLKKKINCLLSDTKSLLLPANANPEVAANNTGNYFAQKVNDIYDHLAQNTLQYTQMMQLLIITHHSSISRNSPWTRS